MLDLQWGEIAWFLPVMLGAGIVAGFIAGLLGVGGGIVVVPVLFHVYSLVGVSPETKMHVAVATSLAIIIATSFSSVMSHHREGAVDFALLKSWAPPMIIGVLIATVVSNHIDERGLTLIFATVAFLIALNMLFGRESWRLGDQVPGSPLKDVFAGAIGFISSLMGIGGGTLGVMTLTLYGVGIHRAIGTCAGFGLLISVPATIGFIVGGLGIPDRPPLSLGYVNLISVACLMPATVLAAPIGARFAHSLSRRRLLHIFALFLIVTSLRMFIGVFS